MMFDPAEKPFGWRQRVDSRATNLETNSSHLSTQEINHCVRN